MHQRLYLDIAVRAAADLLNLVLQLFLVSLLANQLGTFAYGLFSQFTATALILVPILLLRLNTACVRYFPLITKHGGDLRHRFLTLLGITLATSLSAALFMMILPIPLATLIFADARQAFLIPLLGGYCLLRAITLLCIDFFRAVNKTRWSSLFAVLQNGLTLCAVLMAIRTQGGIFSVLGACLAAEGLLSLLLLISIFRIFLLPTQSTHYSDDGIAPYLRYSLPLVPYSLFVSIIQFGDRYFISHLLDLRQAGIYAFAYNLTSAAFLINAAIAYVIYPYLCELWAATEHQQVKKLLEQGLNLFLYFAIPITAGLVLLAPQIIVLLAGNDFLVDRSLILWIALGHLCLGIYTINGYLVDLSQKTGLFLLILLLSAGVNLALNLTLIPSMGLQGAALATFAAYGIQTLILWLFTKRLVGFRISCRPIWPLRCLAATALMFLLLELFPRPNSLWQVLLTITAGATLYTSLTFLLLAKEERQQVISLFTKGYPR